MAELCSNKAEEGSIINLPVHLRSRAWPLHGSVTAMIHATVSYVQLNTGATCDRCSEKAVDYCGRDSDGFAE